MDDVTHRIIAVVRDPDDPFTSVIVTTSYSQLEAPDDETVDGIHDWARKTFTLAFPDIANPQSLVVGEEL